MGGLARIGLIGGAGNPEERIDFGLYRAAFLNAHIDPRAWETMSLYELESLMRALAPKDKTPTDEEWDNAQELLAQATAGMSDVRI